jgi:hypothetical protein
MSENWVTQVAAEERRKELARSHDLAAAAHRAGVVRFHLQYLMVALKDRIARDVEAFNRELPDRRISFEESTVDDGFAVRRDCYPEGHLTVTPNPHEGTIRVQYLFASADGLSAPNLIELIPNADRGFAVHVRGSEPRSFANVEQLSEFLLRPLFIGQAR